jgi:DNA primase
MALIPPHVREQIRSASDIVEIIGAVVPLRRAGASFVALCPFHKEKSPSFNVSPSRQAFYCFGCGKGGDVFRFVQYYENVSFFEAIKRLAQRAGIRVDFEETSVQREERETRDRLRDLNEQITRRWQEALASSPGGQIARDYLERRGVRSEAVKLFRLGYAPEAWDDTVNWARSSQWDMKLVEQAGLIIPRDSGGKSSGGYYDRFRGRLMFPICDEQGRVIAFSGRILQGDEKAGKYVNSPETPLFTKGRVLYGFDKTKRAILEAGSVIICEGQLDLIACFTAGVQNVVAPQGTALTGEHLRILRRFAQEAVLCFDGDAAGQKAAARVLDELLGSGLAIRVIAIPAAHDPDSYIKAHGTESFRQLVSAARDFFEFYLGYLCTQRDLRTDRGKLEVLEGMAIALGKTGNQVLLDHYAQRTAMALASMGGVPLSPEAVRVEFKKHLARGPRPAGQAEREPPPAAARAMDEPEPAEFWLLKLMFLNDDFAGWLALHLNPEWIRHAGIRELLVRRLALHRSGEWQSPAGFLSDIEDDSLRGLASRALSDNRTIPSPEAQLADVCTRLRNAWIDREIAALTLRVSRPEIADDERIVLLQRLQELRASKREPLRAMSPA